MSKSISVKCPGCGHEFSLSDAVLSSVREGLAKELQSTVASREQEIETRQKALDEQQAELKKKTREIQQ